MSLLVVVVKTTTTIKHVDKALTSDSRNKRGTGGGGGGGMALASSFSVFTGLAIVLAAVELFRARGLGAMEQTIDKGSDIRKLPTSATGVIKCKHCYCSCNYPFTPDLDIPLGVQRLSLRLRVLQAP